MNGQENNIRIELTRGTEAQIASLFANLYGQGKNYLIGYCTDTQQIAIMDSGTIQYYTSVNGIAASLISVLPIPSLALLPQPLTAGLTGYISNLLTTATLGIALYARIDRSNPAPHILFYTSAAARTSGSGDVLQDDGTLVYNSAAPGAALLGDNSSGYSGKCDFASVPQGDSSPIDLDFAAFPWNVQKVLEAMAPQLP